MNSKRQARANLAGANLSDVKWDEFTVCPYGFEPQNYLKVTKVEKENYD